MSPQSGGGTERIGLPRQKLVKSLTLSQKIGCVGAAALLTSVVVPLCFINRGFSNDLEFARLERAGIEYQRPLENLLDGFARHQLLARRYAGGERDLAGQLRQTEGEIDAALGALESVDARLGKDLQFTTEGLAKRKREHFRWESLRQEWGVLKSGSGSLAAAESDKQHEHLIGDVRTMIAHAGDMSNLILDSDLDSYYLMDALVSLIPENQERLASIAVLANGLASGAQGDESERTKLAVAAAELKDGDFDRILADARTSLNEDPNFHGVSRTLQQNLPPAVETYAKATEALLAALRKVSDGGTPPSREELAEASGEASRATLALWERGARELDVLLATRVSDVAATRRWAFGLTAVALLIAIGLAAAILHSATRVLRGASRKILQESEGIRAVTRQIAEASQQLSEGASSQAACTEETAASGNEISTMARKNSGVARSAAELVTKSQEGVSEARQSLDAMVASMNEIRLESDKISRIIKVIDEIAFQTNILALNAAVEAARSGEAGAGFAVVADEVRSLAQRSAQAAHDTAELIQASIAKTREGTARVDRVVAAIGDVTGASARVKCLLDELQLGSEEQTHGIEQVTKALVLIESVTQQNTATAEKTAASTAQLNEQSARLIEIVGELVELAGASD